MLKLPCPNCGAEIVFRSAALPSRVCDYCQTIVMRSDQGLEAVGKAAELPFDVSPLMIGSEGRFEDGAFTLVGRVRWGWTDGAWNEWLALFDDGSTAWLGEAMGQYMLLRERDLQEIGGRGARDLLAGRKVPVGTQIELDGESLFVADAREATCLAAEGELPYRAPPGWTIFSVDFRSTSGRCASLQRDGQEASFYDGRYVTLAELQPKGLRTLDGWQVPVFA